MKKELVNNYKQYFKITFTIIGIIVGIILLDSIQALVFDNSPILKIRDHYNGVQVGKFINYKEEVINQEK